MGVTTQCVRVLSATHDAETIWLPFQLRCLR